MYASPCQDHGREAGERERGQDAHGLRGVAVERGASEDEADPVARNACVVMAMTHVIAIVPGAAERGRGQCSGDSFLIDDNLTAGTVHCGGQEAQESGRIRGTSTASDNIHTCIVRTPVPQAERRPRLAGRAVEAADRDSSGTATRT